jgi:PAS domain S-box-containing protein
MPGIGGEGVLTRVRKSNREIPFVILTAHGTVPQAVRLIKQGADNFILKPAEADEIALTIEKALEKVRLEHELAESRATLQMVSENVPDIIYSLNARGEFLSLSPSVKRNMGYRPEELLGTSVFNVIHPDDRLRVGEAFAEAVRKKRKETRNVQFRMVSKGGVVRHFEVTGKFIFERGRVVRSDGIARDITERKALEQQLKEYSQHLEAMVKERTERLEYANRQLSALNAVAGRFSSVHDEERFFDEVPTQLTRTLDFDRAYLLFPEDGRFKVRSFCPGKGSRRRMKEFVNKVNRGEVRLPPHIKRSFTTGRTIFVPDIKKERGWPRKPPFMQLAKSIVLSTIRAQGSSVAVIAGSMDDHDREMDRRDVERFETFVKLVNLALDNIRVYRSLEMKVAERTKSLRSANAELKKKTEQLERTQVEIATANLDLLAARERVQEQNTELETLLAELSKRRDELQTILDTMPELLVLVDESGVIKAANNRMTEYFGLKLDEVTGMPIDEFHERISGLFEDPGSFDAIVSRLKADPDSAGTLDFSEFVARGLKVRDNDEVMLCTTSTSVFDKDGREVGRVWDYINIAMMKEADRRIHTIIKASPIPTIISSLEDGRVLFVNDQLADLVGFPAEELLGRFTPDFYADPADRAKLLEALSRDGAVDNFETRLKRADGSIFWAICSLAVSEISGEKVILGGINDITERRKAEMAVEKRLRYEEGLAALSRELLTGAGKENALSNALGSILGAADVTRVYILENFEDESDGLCMRLTHEASKGGVEPHIGDERFQHIPYGETLDRIKKHLSKGEAVHGPVRKLSKGKRASYGWKENYSMLAIPIFIDKAWYGMIGFDDIREEREWSDDDIRTLRTAAEIIGIFIKHRRFEEALHVSEERFRSLVENANDIIYSFNSQGEFTYISPKASDITGYKAEEIIGRTFFENMHPEDKAEALGWFQSGFQGDDSGMGFEFRMKHKDGSLRWFQTRSSHITDESGNLLEIIGIAHDITQLKKAYEDLEEANRHIKETQTQLVQSEKMASLGMLVAGIAHEINTPIGVVGSMHDTLIRSIDKLKKQVEKACHEGTEERKRLEATLQSIDEANQIIKSGADRVTTIVRRLRSFARLDEAELKTADIHEGLEDTLTLIHHEIKHDITVKKDYGDIPPIACYPGKLNQVFLNILVNARQAIRGKGEITIRTFAEGGKVHVEIGDTGSGIPKENLAKVFDPGFTTKGVGVGTGLGLSICYQIILDHRGTITVESEHGKGTTFFITIPMNLEEILDRS